MPILSRCGKFVLRDHNVILAVYGVKRVSNNQWGRKDRLRIDTEVKITIRCDECSKIVIVRWGSIRKHKEGVYCAGCACTKTKKQKYGWVYNNPEKRAETNLERYGMVGTPRKGIKQPPWSDSSKRKLSIFAKGRLEDKRNHPLYGRKHSEESKLKNSLSNSETWSRMIITGQDRRRTGGYESGYFFSTKMGREVKYRSSFEKAFYFTLEMCNSVVSYEVESLRVSYLYEGRNHYYIPDVLVKFSNGLTSLVEVKPKPFQSHEVNIEKFEAARLYCKEHDIHSFEVLDSGEFFRFILLNIEEEGTLFNNKFMQKLDKFTSGLKAEDFK